MYSKVLLAFLSGQIGQLQEHSVHQGYSVIHFFVLNIIMNSDFLLSQIYPIVSFRPQEILHLQQSRTASQLFVTINQRLESVYNR